MFLGFPATLDYNGCHSAMTKRRSPVPSSIKSVFMEGISIFTRNLPLAGGIIGSAPGNSENTFQKSSLVPCMSVSPRLINQAAFER